MLPIEFFSSPGFSMGLIAIMLAFFVMFSFMLPNASLPVSKGAWRIECGTQILTSACRSDASSGKFEIALLLSLEVLELSVQGLP